MYTIGKIIGYITSIPKRFAYWVNGEYVDNSCCHNVNIVSEVKSDGKTVNYCEGCGTIHSVDD